MKGASHCVCVVPSLGEWLEEWEERHPDPTNSVNVKATQPAHRALTHLLHLIVRCVFRKLLGEHYEGGDFGVEDLQVNKKDAKRLKECLAGPQ